MSTLIVLIESLISSPSAVFVINADTFDFCKMLGSATPLAPLADVQ